MADLFSKSGDLSKNVDIEAAVLAPLLLRDERPPDENSPAITAISLLLVSLLSLCLFVLSSMLEIRMELVDPLLIDAQEHQGVGITLLIIHALQLADVDRVSAALDTEDTSSLRVDGTDIDSLLHALQSHAEEKDPSDLQIDWQVDKDLAQCGNLWLVLLSLIRHSLAILGQDRWRDGQSTCLLQVLDGVVDIAELRRLDGPP